MSCGAGVRHVTRALGGVTGVVHTHVDLRTNEAFVEHRLATWTPQRSSQPFGTLATKRASPEGSLIWT